MKNSNVGKKLLASTCAAALALSMPVLAFAEGEDAQPENAPIVQDDPAPSSAAAEATQIEGTGTGLDIVGDILSAPDPENPVEVSDSFTADASVDKAADGEEASIELNEVDTANSANADFVEQAKKGELTGSNEAANIEGGALSEKTFTVAAENAASDATVTVVYTVTDNATGIKCYVYVIYTDAKGDVQHVAQEVTATSAGVYEYSLPDNATSATITFALVNENGTKITAPVETGKYAVSSSNKNADGKYLVNYETATQTVYNAAGAKDTEVSATATMLQDAEASVAGQITATLSGTNAGTYEAYIKQFKDPSTVIGKFVSVDVTSANPNDVQKANVQLYVGTQFAGKNVMVFGQSTNGDPIHFGDSSFMTTSVNSKGYISFDPEHFTIYTFAVLNGDAPVVPDVPVDPDQPTNPDAPIVVPGNDDNGSADGVAGKDDGTTSPKTGYIL